MRTPLLLEMAGQPVVCVGAGPVAAGKVVPLMECGAVVTVIAPQVDAGLARAEHILRRDYQPGDLEGPPRPRLVVAGTGVAATDDLVAAEAAALGIWCLRIDGEGDVAVPSVIRRGALVVALATGAPALTRRLRQVLGEALDDHWGVASKTLAALRSDPVIRAALAAVPASERRRRWREAVEVVLDRDTPPDPGRAAAQAILTGRTDD
ncbi:MAG TPA: NAD(P)-dependent oxidoreductase [Euzebya sp.]|nr:NAD(P)-dependent oxidoreductase [Euzebya sp.]